MKSKNSLRVLVAEDNPAIHEEIKNMLADLGQQVVGNAYNGPEAVAQCVQVNPDVILIDLVMPDPETGREDRHAGIRATEAMMRHKPVAIVWLTAHESPDLIAQANELGVSAYLVKPARSGDLARVLMVAHARFADLQELRRLNAALEAEIEMRKRAEESLRQTNSELQTTLAEVRTLRGLLPICSFCKRIRDEKEHWHQVETYVRAHSEANFTHTYCPDCLKEHFPGLT